MASNYTLAWILTLLKFKENFFMQYFAFCAQKTLRFGLDSWTTLTSYLDFSHHLVRLRLLIQQKASNLIAFYSIWIWDWKFHGIQYLLVQYTWKLFLKDSTLEYFPEFHLMYDSFERFRYTFSLKSMTLHLPGWNKQFPTQIINLLSFFKSRFYY